VNLVANEWRDTILAVAAEEPDHIPYGLARVFFADADEDHNGLNGCLVYVDGDAEFDRDLPGWEVPCLLDFNYEGFVTLPPECLTPLTESEEKALMPFWALPVHTAEACELCGWTPPAVGHGSHGLTVHHIRPRAAGGGEHPANKMRICANCHGIAHGLIKRQRRDDDGAWVFIGPQTRAELRMAFKALMGSKA